jgi:hypothetical protein
MLGELKKIDNMQIIHTDYIEEGNMNEEYRVILLPKEINYKSYNIKQYYDDTSSKNKKRKYRNNLLLNINNNWICNIHLYHSSNKRDIFDFLEKVLDTSKEEVLFIGDTNNRISEDIQDILNFKLILPNQQTFLNEMDSIDEKKNVKPSNIIDGYFITKYFNRLDLESERWINFFNEILSNNLGKIYCKGGSVLGLYCYSINTEEKNNNYIQQLIKDFDFTIYTDDNDTNNIIKKIESIGNKYYLFNEAQTMTILRFKFPTYRNEDVFYECSVKKKKNLYNDYELPLTNMKIEINNKKTLNDLFTVMKSNYNNTFYTEKIKDKVTDLIIIIDKSENGLLKIESKKINAPELLTEIIESVTENTNEQFFLYNHVQEIDRLFYRLFEKNIVKSNKIKAMFPKLENEKWLINNEHIISLVDKFIGKSKQILLPLLINFIKNFINIQIIKQTKYNNKDKNKDIRKIIEENININKEIKKIFYLNDNKNYINLGRINDFVSNYKPELKSTKLFIDFFCINEIIKYKYKTKYVVIDANQTAQWDSIGIRNIKQFLKHMDSKLKIKLIEKYSTVAMPRLKKKYDISFIDGSHDELIVIEDIRDSDRILVKNGLMIIDDVLHVGVKDAILRFFTKNKNYSRISILENSNKFIREYTLYSIDLKKQSFSNPKTMYCFQKLI